MLYRTKKFLTIVKNNIYSYQSQIIDNNDPDENFLAARINTDCFSLYKELEFKRLGYILYQINRLICFGQGLIHSNSIEGLEVVSKG